MVVDIPVGIITAIKYKRKAERAAETERILSTPLQTSSADKGLLDKYK